MVETPDLLVGPLGVSRAGRSPALCTLASIQVPVDVWLSTPVVFPHPLLLNSAVPSASLLVSPHVQVGRCCNSPTSHKKHPTALLPYSTTVASILPPHMRDCPPRPTLRQTDEGWKVPALMFNINISPSIRLQSFLHNIELVVVFKRPISIQFNR